MAKQQSFAEKVNKAKQEKVATRAVRVILPRKSPQGVWKFVDKIVQMPEDVSEDQFYADLVKKAEGN